MSENRSVMVQDKPDEIRDIRKRFLDGKRKRIDTVSGYMDKIRTELDKRDLKEVPTPLLARMFVQFADMAKKDEPIIELQYSEEIKGKSAFDIDDKAYRTETITI